ncbi:hypothetical protein DFA_01312 [Cavenderia fasciculata]|uniref:Fluoroacetyl-CoA-specific thioesterase-like domain-containing protein n=1 Tax=Cavenderia fasciculata TaxID=261658 RepID=F4PS45_CACFS|nr:uncharacterized protein DFA_01312 [Cavenderia fasciculata]EGG21428.1 hypothetical protein DFA_01312 [Cavenderia fasciculata]|eukprot:XP_004359278.1 hypothetical protein DFA_01312 [Cavenderia fasciculata]
MSNCQPPPNQIRVCVGDTQELTALVTNDLLATNVGSGDVEVLSTPSLIALFERVSCDLLRGNIDANMTTVGTSINVQHLDATPLGIQVRVIATVTSVESKKVSFKCEAFDTKKIGEGTHERYLVNRDRFLERANSKRV